MVGRNLQFLPTAYRGGNTMNTNNPATQYSCPDWYDHSHYNADKGQWVPDDREALIREICQRRKAVELPTDWTGDLCE